jgi:ABC-type multidrug transport system fused ATPase/permease subunit
VNRLLRIFRLTLKYRKNLWLNLVFGWFSTFFGLFSLVLVAPLLEIIFYPQAQALGLPPVWEWSRQGISTGLAYRLQLLSQNYGPQGALLAVCLIIIAAILLKNGFHYLATRHASVVVNRSTEDLRNALFKRLLEMPQGYLTDSRKGELLARLSNDVQDIEFSMLSVVTAFFRHPLHIATYVATLLWLSPALTLFLILFMPLTGGVIGLVSRALRKNTRMAQQHFGRLIAHLEESLTAMKMIRSFKAEPFFSDRFESENRLYTQRRIRMFRQADLAVPLGEVMGVAAVAAVLWWGGAMVFSAQISAALFITYIVVFAQLIEPFKGVSRSIYDAQKGVAALQGIEAMLEQAEAQDLPEGQVKFAGLQTEIQLKNLGFHYGGEWILRDLNFSIPKGKTLAIVGPSGSGKTTLMNLLARFYDPHEGQIWIDNKPLTDLQLQDWRQKTALVSQESLLFNDTIAANIGLSHTALNQTRLIAAAEQAHALDFIQEQPQGFQTVVGDGGNRLSGGQKQRIGLARALYHGAEILFLDEATSALDSASEKAVQDALANLAGSHTLVVVAHRLSTVQSAQQILVLNAGRIEEQGSHAELMEKGGIYRSMVDLQAIK